MIYNIYSVHSLQVNIYIKEMCYTYSISFWEKERCTNDIHSGLRRWQDWIRSAWPGKLDQEESGLDAAKRLRAESYAAELVFLTNFQDYVFDRYPVHALDYLLKPASYEKISHCMNQVLRKCSDSCFFYRVRDSVLQIPYQNILYFSSRNHAIDIITVQKTYTIPQTLRNVLKILPGQFVQCHRTVLVNLSHIEFMNNSEILLSNQDRLPIGRMYLKKLQQDIISLVHERRAL